MNYIGTVNDFLFEIKGLQKCLLDRYLLKFLYAAFPNNFLYYGFTEFPQWKAIRSSCWNSAVQCIAVQFVAM